MPVTNSKQITRMVSMCGASLPRKFTRIIQKYEDNPTALQDAGIAYAIAQIIELLAAGVDGIHLYTMNNPYVARKSAKPSPAYCVQPNDEPQYLSVTA